MIRQSRYQVYDSFACQEVSHPVLDKVAIVVPVSLICTEPQVASPFYGRNKL